MDFEYIINIILIVLITLDIIMMIDVKEKLKVLLK